MTSMKIKFEQNFVEYKTATFEGHTWDDIYIQARRYFDTKVNWLYDDKFYTKTVVENTQK